MAPYDRGVQPQRPVPGSPARDQEIDDDAARPTFFGRRFAALAIDWFVASAISAGFFAYDPWATLAVFAGMTFLLVATTGFTIGHRLLGLRVYRIADGGAPPHIVQALVRTLCVCLVLPAVVWGVDGRGLHDIWAGTRIDRLR